MLEPRAPRRFESGDNLENVRVGDVVMSMGVRHLITRIEPYDAGRVGYAGVTWCFAYEDRTGDDGRYRHPWGITIPSDRPLGTRGE